MTVKPGGSAALAEDTMLVHVKQSTLVNTCGDQAVVGAHFVINQIDDPPASITVTTSDGATTIVPLTFTSGPTAHYVMTLSAGVTVVDATAVVPTTWTGEFVLSNYECGTAGGPSASSTPPESIPETTSPPESTTPESSTVAVTTPVSSTAASSTAASSTPPESTEVAAPSPPSNSTSPAETESPSGETAVNAPAPPLPTPANVATSSAAPNAVTSSPQENVAAGVLVNAPPPAAGFPAGATGMQRQTPSNSTVWLPATVASTLALVAVSLANRRMRRRGGSRS